ncbi:hypothetical protein [Photobacterium damselae]|uniref:hypothetical protein n=1 Tax=Photobacterium damselae TaxID=38293 RepID=UPI001EFD04B9|nr:hypothetical protein [Photobacterium damselae]MCG9778824.1 hypothetical protein [Photobacterium damselae]
MKYFVSFLYLLSVSIPFFVNAADSPIKLEFPVSTLIDKNNFYDSRIVITGLNGMALTAEDLKINSDGSFSSKKNIITEAHMFDVETETVSGLITNKDYSSIAWSVERDPIVSSSGPSNVFTARAALYNHSYFGVSIIDMKSAPIEGEPDLLNRVSWSIKSVKGKNITEINPGDTISVTTIITLTACL